MRAPPAVRKIEATLVDARVEWPDAFVRFEPVRGDPTPIEDRIRLEPQGELPAIEGVGRILRILKAARFRTPDQPYEFAADPERLEASLRRCIGARVVLKVARRMERVLTVWTDAGVDRIGGVVDFDEDGEGLRVRRRGGQSVLLIPRRSLIRFSCETFAHPEVVAVETPER